MNSIAKISNTKNKLTFEEFLKCSDFARSNIDKLTGMNSKDAAALFSTKTGILISPANAARVAKVCCVALKKREPASVLNNEIDHIKTRLEAAERAIEKLLTIISDWQQDKQTTGL